MKYENVTQEEIDNLPLELQCCFYLQGWNKTFKPTSISEWSKEIGWIAFRNDFEDSFFARMPMLASAERAEKEATRLYQFVSGILARKGK